MIINPVLATHTQAYDYIRRQRYIHSMLILALSSQLFNVAQEKWKEPGACDMDMADYIPWTCIVCIKWNHHLNTGFCT